MAADPLAGALDAYCPIGEAFSGGWSPCMLIVLRDVVQVVGALLGLVRLVLLCMWVRSSPEPVNKSQPRQQTTGELLDFCKCTISLFFALLPVGLLLDMARGSMGDIGPSLARGGAQPGLALDAIVRTVTWFFSFVVARTAQKYGAKESWLMRVWWIAASVVGLMCAGDALASLPSLPAVQWVYFYDVTATYVSGVLHLVLLVCALAGNYFYYSKGDGRGVGFTTAWADAQAENDALLRHKRASAVTHDRGQKWHEMTHGEQLFKNCLYQNADEFRKLRYTPVTTVDPRHFSSENSELRCGLGSTSADTRMRLLFCVTLSSEGPEAFKNTMRGVCENLLELVQREGDDIFARVACVVLVDGFEGKGREYCHPDTLALAELWGLFNREMIEIERERVKDMDASPTTMHLFEFSGQLSQDENFVKFFPPLQVIFALKEQRTGKLDSQRWFFEAFCSVLNPKYCFCTYAGVDLGPRAVYKLYMDAETHEDYGAVCAEVRTPGAAVRQDWVVSAQGFHYKMSHVLDRALETMCGFVLRMPEHATLYRWDAIKPDQHTGYSPLREYFRAVEQPLDVTEDMHLVHRHAPQRVLQFQMLARPGARWTTAYVKNAYAVVQVPVEMDQLIERQGRWLNASHLGVLYNISNFPQLWHHSSHPVGRKLLILFEHLYTAVAGIIAWFMPALFFALFLVSVRAFKQPCESYLGDTQYGCWDNATHGHKGTLFGFVNNSGYKLGITRAAASAAAQPWQSPLGLWTCDQDPKFTTCYPMPLCQGQYHGDEVVDCCTGACREAYQFATDVNGGWWYRFALTGQGKDQLVHAGNHTKCKRMAFNLPDAREPLFVSGKQDTGKIQIPGEVCAGAVLTMAETQRVAPGCTPWMPNTTILGTLFSGEKQCYDSPQVTGRTNMHYPIDDPSNVVGQHQTCCSPALPGNTTKETQGRILQALKANPKDKGFNQSLESWILYNNDYLRFHEGSVREVYTDCGQGTVMGYGTPGKGFGNTTSYQCFTEGCGSGMDPSTIIELIFVTFLAILLVSTFTFCIGNEPKDIVYESKLCATFFGLSAIVVVYSYIIFVFQVTDDDLHNAPLPIPAALLQYGTLLLFGLLLIACALHGEMPVLVTGMPQYFFFLPTVLFTCEVYALSTLNKFKVGMVQEPSDVVIASEAAEADDGDEAKASDAMLQKVSPQTRFSKKEVVNDFETRTRVHKAHMVMIWLVANTAMVWGLLKIGGGKLEKRAMFGVFFCVMWFTIGLKFVGSFLFMAHHYFEHNNLCGIFGDTHRERVKKLQQAETIAAAQRLLMNEENEKRLRKADRERAEKFLNDVMQDAEVFGPADENDALRPAIGYARQALMRVAAHEPIIAGSLSAEANAECRPNSSTAFSGAMEDAIKSVNELQNLALERRKLLHFRRQLPNIVDLRHFDENPKLRVAHQSAKDAIAIATSFPWERLGQLKDVRERVKKAGAFVEQLRNMERLRRERVLHECLEHFNSVIEVKLLAEADSAGQVARVRRRLRKCHENIEAGADDWEELEEQLRGDLDELEDLRKQVVAGQREHQHAVWKTISELSRKLEGPATHEKGIHNDAMANDVEHAQELLLELQQVANDPTKLDRSDGAKKFVKKKKKAPAPKQPPPPKPLPAPIALDDDIDDGALSSGGSMGDWSDDDDDVGRTRRGNSSWD
eukprot:g1910.t1